jgi:hypothetical protein
VAGLALAGTLSLIGWLGIAIETPARALGTVAVAGPVGMAAYLLANRVCGMRELPELVRALRR